MSLASLRILQKLTLRQVGSGKRVKIPYQSCRDFYRDK